MDSYRHTTPIFLFIICNLLCCLWPTSYCTTTQSLTVAVKNDYPRWFSQPPRLIKLKKSKERPANPIYGPGEPIHGWIRTAARGSARCSPDPATTGADPATAATPEEGEEAAGLDLEVEEDAIVEEERGALLESPPPPRAQAPPRCQAPRELLRR
jgi:hypothetical protein